jgi:hydrogenase nickel incorporation protein HypA/HybF
MDDVLREILAVADAEGAVRVARVRVWLGALSHFTPEHFREHYQDAARRTIAAEAEIEATLDGDPADPNAQGVVIESVDIAHAAQLH